MTELNLISPDEFKENIEVSRYTEEREAIKTGSVLDRFREDSEQKFEKARQDDDFWDILGTPQDRVKADQNKDGKINYDEYREYILPQDQTNQLVQKTNNPNATTTYHLDYSFYIIIGMVCLTIIMVMWIKKK